MLVITRDSVTEVQKSGFKQTIESSDSPAPSKKCKIMEVSLKLNEAVDFVQGKLYVSSEGCSLNVSNSWRECTTEVQQIAEIQSDHSPLTAYLYTESEIENMLESVLKKKHKEKIQCIQDEESANSSSVHYEAETADLKALMDLVDEKDQVESKET